MCELCLFANKIQMMVPDLKTLAYSMPRRILEDIRTNRGMATG